LEKKGLIIIVVLAILYWWTRTPNFVDDSTLLELKYHVEYPTGGSSSKSLPLIIALHGNGDTYDNFYKYTLKDFTTPARVILIEAPNKYWPYDLAQLSKYSQAIANFSLKMKHQFATEGDPILLGYSGGAVMAYYSALTQCDKYSMIVPISGKLQNEMVPDNIATDNRCHVLAFHGKSDQVVSYSGGEYAIKQLKKYSKNITLISFDGGHQGVFLNYKQMAFDKISERIRTL